MTQGRSKDYGEVVVWRKRNEKKKKNHKNNVIQYILVIKAKTNQPSLRNETKKN